MRVSGVENSFDMKTVGIRISDSQGCNPSSALRLIALLILMGVTFLVGSCAPSRAPRVSAMDGSIVLETRNLHEERIIREYLLLAEIPHELEGHRFRFVRCEETRRSMDHLLGLVTEMAKCCSENISSAEDPGYRRVTWRMVLNGEDTVVLETIKSGRVDLDSELELKLATSTLCRRLDDVLASWTKVPSDGK